MKQIKIFKNVRPSRGFRYTIYLSTGSGDYTTSKEDSTVECTLLANPCKSKTYSFEGSSYIYKTRKKKTEKKSCTSCQSWANVCFKVGEKSECRVLRVVSWRGRSRVLSSGGATLAPWSDRRRRPDRRREDRREEALPRD